MFTGVISLWLKSFLSHVLGHSEHLIHSIFGWLKFCYCHMIREGPAGPVLKSLYGGMHGCLDNQDLRVVFCEALLE